MSQEFGPGSLLYLMCGATLLHVCTFLLQLPVTPMYLRFPISTCPRLGKCVQAIFCANDVSLSALASAMANAYKPTSVPMMFPFSACLRRGKRTEANCHAETKVCITTCLRRGERIEANFRALVWRQAKAASAWGHPKLNDACARGREGVCKDSSNHV
eukprot:1159876-Pelagomonas_calceolata.AAC.3